MNWKSLFCAMALPVLGLGLESQPWFGDVYEFYFLGSYAYSRFHSIQGAIPAWNQPFQSNLVYLGLEFCPSPDWSLDADVQVADTTAKSFYFRSVALQSRYLWLDDVIGDPISLSTGLSARFTNSPGLQDVSCPSHGNVDFELNFSLGKEFDAVESWRWRLWCYGAVGHANRGSPWVRAIAALEMNVCDRHKWALYGMGSNGYGRHSHLDVEDFYGYAKIRQKSIDIGIRYGYRAGVWGTLRFEYQRRLLAKASPRQVNTWMFSYLLPFCF